jgi:hypothetical protein
MVPVAETWSDIILFPVQIQGPTEHAELFIMLGSYPIEDPLFLIPLSVWIYSIDRNET